jgi:predicted glycoside hydrolase/deacetylase ChbG (UPF0249 family)
MTTQIAIAVDDFGEHVTINTAALALARAGRISAISCMVGGPAWPDGAAALRELDRPQVDLGLHLDLTQYPLETSPRPLARLIGAAWLRRLDPHRLRSEVERQCDAFEADARRAPDHVDGHQHVHQLPQVRELLVDTLCRRYDPHPWLRDTRRAHFAGRTFDSTLLRADMKAAVIERLGADPLRHLAAGRGVPQNRRLLGIHGLQADARTYRRLLGGWLGVAQTGDLLVAHPASALAGATGPMAANRSAEYAVLGSAEFGDLLVQAEVEVVPMSALLAGDRAG